MALGREPCVTRMTPNKPNPFAGLACGRNPRWAACSRLKHIPTVRGHPLSDFVQAGQPSHVPDRRSQRRQLAVAGRTFF